MERLPLLIINVTLSLKSPPFTRSWCEKEEGCGNNLKGEGVQPLGQGVFEGIWSRWTESPQQLPASRLSVTARTLSPP